MLFCSSGIMSVRLSAGLMRNVVSTGQTMMALPSLIIVGVVRVAVPPSLALAV